MQGLFDKVFWETVGSGTTSASLVPGGTPCPLPPCKNLIYVFNHQSLSQNRYDHFCYY
jgi:hypothetical protein